MTCPETFTLIQTSIGCSISGGSMNKFSGIIFSVLILSFNILICQESLTIKQISTIGDEENENFNYLLDGPIDIAFDSNSNIYILEENGRCIKIFDNSGKFLKQIGRKGKGPGEFTTVTSLGLDNKNNIYVADIGSGRITKLSPDGKYISTIQAPYNDLEFSINSKNKLLFVNPNLNGGRNLSKNNVPLFCEINKKGKLINFFGQGVYFSKFPFSTGGNRLKFCLDKKDNIIAAFLFQNIIKKYSPEGKLILEIKLNPHKEKLINSELNLYSALNEGIAADNKNRIWVLTRLRNEKKEEKIIPYTLWDSSSGTKSTTYKGNLELTETDIFALDCFEESGKHLKRFQLNHFCDGIKIKDNRIYILEKIREMKFYVYEICD